METINKLSSSRIEIVKTEEMRDVVDKKDIEAQIARLQALLLEFDK